MCQRTYTKGLRAAYNEICTKETIKGFSGQRGTRIGGILLLFNIAIFASAVSECREENAGQGFSSLAESCYARYVGHPFTLLSPQSSVATKFYLYLHDAPHLQAVGDC